jgi:hypothetical protein
MSESTIRRRNFLGGVVASAAAAVATVAAPVVVQAEGVKTVPAAWASDWPPSADPSAVLVTFEPTAPHHATCRNCGQEHRVAGRLVYTSACLPALWVGSVPDPEQGTGVSGFAVDRELEPPDGLHGVQGPYWEGPQWRYVVVRKERP